VTTSMQDRSERDRLAANTIRALTLDATQASGDGHPGMPMGAAPMGWALYRHVMRHDPSAPDWWNRDRYVQSAGHGSMLQYALLHLSGYDLTMDDLRGYRQWGSRTPGHPEVGHTPGVETTTGPLGQGLATAVGMALAEKHLAARFNREGFDLIDHRTWVIAGDGDLMEGVTSEASSLAGHLGLGKLTVLYDDNGISIDGTTDITFSEDVLARYEAYGWHVQRVADGNDGEAILAALDAARAASDQPSLIAVRSVIGFGSPNLAGTSKVHGSVLGRRRRSASTGPPSRFRPAWKRNATPFVKRDPPRTPVGTTCGFGTRVRIPTSRRSSRAACMATCRQGGTQSCLPGRRREAWRRGRRRRWR